MNNIKLFSTYSLIIMGVCIGTTLLAQPNLPAEEVQVVKSFEARVANASRLELNPQLPAFDTTKLDYDFSVSQRNISPSYTPPALRALGVSRPPDEDYYNGFVRAGYGFPSSPLADLHYTFDNKETQIGIDGSHYSVNNDGEVPHQFLMDNDLNLNFRHILNDAAAIKAGAFYSLDRFDLYGYDADVDSFSDEQAKRQFNTYGIKVGLENPGKNDLRLDYNFEVGFQNHSDNLEASEDLFQVEGKAVKWIKDNPLSLEASFENIRLDDGDEKTLSNLRLIPAYSFFGNGWSAKLGLQYARGGEENYIYPEIKAQYKLPNTEHVIFAGSNGQLQAQSFHRLSTYNRFLQSGLDTLVNQSTLKIYAGIKGKIKKVNYEFEASWNQVDNFTTYLPRLDDRRFFHPLFDNGNVISLNLSASTPVFNQFLASVNVSQQFISLDSLEKAWHIPTFTLDAKTTYYSERKNFQAFLGFRIQNGVPYLNAENEAENLEALFDINLGFDYYFTEYLGIFAHAYNVLGNTRERWEQYPIVGRNILGGIIVRF